MGVPRTLTGILAALTVPVLLTGCGGGDESVADPPISPAPTSSPTQSPEGETPEQFIRRWVDEDTRMQNTGDSSGFRRMSSGCNGCDAVADRVDSIYRAGGSVHTDGWSLVRVSESAKRGKTRTVELIVDSAPTTYTPSRGAKRRYLDGGREHFQVQVKPTHASWTVTEFVQVSS